LTQKCGNTNHRTPKDIIIWGDGWGVGWGGGIKIHIEVEEGKEWSKK